VSKESFRDFSEGYSKQIYSEIEGKGKEHVLNINEEEYEAFLIQKYTLEPIKVFKESEQRHAPTDKTIKRRRDYDGQTIQVNAYACKVTYNYVGSNILFNYHPSTSVIYGYEVEIDKIQSTTTLEFTITKQDPELYEHELNSAFKSAFCNVSNMNTDVKIWNDNLPKLVKRHFITLKEKFKKENSFFEAIRIKVDTETKSLFTVPSIQKKAIPQPQVSKKAFTSEPTMNIEMYEDVLKVLFDFGRSMERKPSTYQGKDEEAIRDLLITILETRYEATTATGESFNKGGKTDILLKYQDGSNLFVGECKWWKGEKEFSEAINQLFDNYLTWRDSKTALFFFVKNKDISTVNSKILETVKDHPYFKSHVISKEDGRHSFIFHLPGDSNREVYLEIMTFHFNANQ
jgi:hypothetical protein